MRLECEPVEEYSKEIAEILGDAHPNFPFEYYSIKFVTFAGQAYTATESSSNIYLLIARRLVMSMRLGNTRSPSMALMRLF